MWNQTKSNREIMRENMVNWALFGRRDFNVDGRFDENGLVDTLLKFLCVEIPTARPPCPECEWRRTMRKYTFSISTLFSFCTYFTPLVRAPQRGRFFNNERERQQGLQEIQTDYLKLADELYAEFLQH